MTKVRADPDACYKIVVVGASGVGKTALVQRLVDDSFSSTLAPTIGVEFKCYRAVCGDEIVKLNIWDTAGQEKFKSVAKAYFREAVGGVLVFAQNDQQSFDDLSVWLTDIQTLCTPNAVVLLVGNKSDLTDERVVVTSEAEAFALRHGLDYFETSALNAHNVVEAFVRLAGKLHERIKKGEIQVTESEQNRIKIKQEPEQVSKGGGCC
jgi:small GTP-binding protein